MISKIATTVLLFSTIIGSALGQSKTDSIKQLRLGDQVPDVFINTVIGYNKPSVRVSEFKGKLLLLDFWSIWCSGCVAALPKLEQLQADFKDRVVILPISFTKTKQEVEAFLKKMAANGKAINLPSAIYEHMENEWTTMFPTWGFPLVIWIDENSRVIGITESGYVTSENIKRALNHEPLNLPLAYAYKSSGGKGSATDSTHFPKLLFGSRLTTFISPANGGKYPGSHFRCRKEDHFWNIECSNEPILNLFKVSVYGGVAGHALNKNVVVQFRDSGYIFPPQGDTNYHANFEKNTYCYELKMPDTIPLVVVLSKMKDDLSKFFGIQALLQKRVQPCWILKRISSDDLPGIRTERQEAYERYDKVSGRLVLKGVPVKSLIGRMAEFVAPIIVDETGYGSMDIEITFKKGDSIEDINDSLKKYNLKLETGSREIECLVLTKSRP